MSKTFVWTQDGYFEVDITNIHQWSSCETKIRMGIDGKYYTGVLLWDGSESEEDTI